MFGINRWCFTTCALFILCPRKCDVAAGLLKNWSNINKGSNLKLFELNGKPPVSFYKNILRDEGSNSTLEETEPGFDFNEEEIKNLKIWPGGAIPYYIDQFSFDKVFRDRLRAFLDATNGVTGLNFLELHRPPDDTKSRWVFFVNRQGLLSCADHPLKNFTSEGVQKVLLGYDCLSSGGQLAEMVLALVGVPPQHNAPDRDKYIKIETENIMPGKAHLFESLKDTEWLFHEVDYDFASAGHYSLHKYTVNGKATIKPVNKQSIAIGEGKGFSSTDILKIKMVYNYISKKRLKSVSFPECNKLFDFGTNFSNYRYESNDDIKPREKPNKYLGLSNTNSSDKPRQSLDNSGKDKKNKGATKKQKDSNKKKDKNKKKSPLNENSNEYQTTDEEDESVQQSLKFIKPAKGK